MNPRRKSTELQSYLFSTSDYGRCTGSRFWECHLPAVSGQPPPLKKTAEVRKQSSNMSTNCVGLRKSHPFLNSQLLHQQMKLVPFRDRSFKKEKELSTHVPHTSWQYSEPRLLLA